jgi:hypothetical protein
LSDLPDFLSGSKSFNVPVYAVWGNHEDHQVVEKFRSGDCRVENLFLLDESNSFHHGPFQIFGLGGNVINGPQLFQNPLAGREGKLWSTISQFADLCRHIEHSDRNGAIRIFVSHVSPGKEPLVSIAAAKCRADLVLSGHMGAPLCMVWNEFAIRDLPDSRRRLEVCLERIRAAWVETVETTDEHGAGHIDRIASDLEYLENLPSETVHAGRSVRVPRWYREMGYLNLPDAPQGYAILDSSDGQLSIITHSNPPQVG